MFKLSFASIFYVEFSDRMKLYFLSSSRKLFFSFYADSSFIPDTSNLGVSISD